MLAMNYFLQQLINGISLGAVYGLIAIGYTMVYGIIGMINFAHGDIMMVGAFISLVGLLLMAVLGITYVPAAIALVLILAALFTAAYGWTVERIFYPPSGGAPNKATGECTQKMVQDGRFLESQFTFHTADGKTSTRTGFVMLSPANAGRFYLIRSRMET